MPLTRLQWPGPRLRRQGREQPSSGGSTAALATHGSQKLHLASPPLRDPAVDGGGGGGGGGGDGGANCKEEDGFEMPRLNPLNPLQQPAEAVAILYP